MQQQLDFKAIDQFSRTVIDTIDFTRRSEEIFYDTVDLADFLDKDAETIFNCLKNEIRLIPFGDYLTRYIYLKAGMSGDYRAIDIREYQHIVIDSFAENNTPKSFVETTAKISALSKKLADTGGGKPFCCFSVRFWVKHERKIEFVSGNQIDVFDLSYAENTMTLEWTEPRGVMTSSYQARYTRS